MVAALPQPTERVPSSAEMAQTVIGYEAAWISAVGPAPAHARNAPLPQRSGSGCAAYLLLPKRKGIPLDPFRFALAQCEGPPLPSVKVRPCPV